MRTVLVLAVLVLSAAAARGRADDDILIADFEGDDYGAWRAEGDAFGTGPARGTLPGQMAVSGFRGSGLVNSFLRGDRSTGTLTSPPIRIEREFLCFLIGGGGYEGTTCINLLVDGKPVRTAAGPNTSPGGSEELAPHHWEVGDLKGRQASLQIVDRATGGWGHINIDHIYLSNTKPAAPNRNAVLTREFRCENDYLLIPIRTGARKCRVALRVGGDTVREFDAEIAETDDRATFWSFLDLAPFAGKTATLEVKGVSEESLALIAQSDELPGADEVYGESLRPQFHFSQRVGWNNDPNGLVYLDGEWHLYFQHNPYGWNWGNMHWGHAVSTDLVHWRQMPIAIYNPRHGDWAFSGGAVVDEHNTAGWQTGENKVVVASWTSTGRGECLSFSNDRGRTFTEFERNPAIKHSGRDPKIVWYEPGRHWVLAVYDESPEHGRAIAFYTSNDLREWELRSKLPGYYECPELFELPVGGRDGESRWVVFAADAQYAVGRFDGATFTPDHEGKHRVHYGDYYASQIFSNAPDGRRIQIGWARIAMRGMPFNQTFTFPHELRLQTTPDGIRLFAEPVREIDSLRVATHSAPQHKSLDDGPVAMDVPGELFDIRAEFEIGTAESVGLEIGGERVTYDARAGRLQNAELSPVDGRITVRVLVDRPMIEVCGNHGRVTITAPRTEPGAPGVIRALAEGRGAKLVKLEVHQLRSIWE